MRTRSHRPKPAFQVNNWIVLGTFLLFALVLSAIFLVIFQSPQPELSPIPSAAPTNTLEFSTATTTITPSPPPPTLLPSSTPQIYVVKEGDTLSSIALEFGVSVDVLQAANGLSSDLIFPEQQLLVPTSQLALTSPVTLPTDSVAVSVTSNQYRVTNTDTLESIAAGHGLDLRDLRYANRIVGDTLIPGQFITVPADLSVSLPPWSFSIINGDLSHAYPLALDGERFTLHYQPGMFPAQDPSAIAQLEQSGLDFLESFTGLRLESRYDVYVAGSNFEPPNRALRGITVSAYLKTFFLHDGTGNVDDQRYITTHELTHLFLWNTIGSPASPMLSEGVAVYTGMEMIQNSKHMPIETFCAAYLQAGALPSVSGTLSLAGHIFDLQNYYAAGCFVKYLVDTYGLDSFELVYHSGDYIGVYGKSLSSLESEWRVYLAAVLVPAELDPAELVSAVSDLASNYRIFFSGFTGNPRQLDAYRELDKARIALLQGDLAAMRDLLDTFGTIQ